MHFTIKWNSSCRALHDDEVQTLFAKASWQDLAFFLAELSFLSVAIMPISQFLIQHKVSQSESNVTMLCCNHVHMFSYYLAWHQHTLALICEYSMRWFSLLKSKLVFLQLKYKLQMPVSLPHPSFFFLKGVLKHFLNIVKNAADNMRAKYRSNELVVQEQLGITHSPLILSSSWWNIFLSLQRQWKSTSHLHFWSWSNVVCLTFCLRLCYTR